METITGGAEVFNPREFEAIQGLKQALKTLNEEWAMFAEVERVKAKLKREFFEGCLEAGFTEKEALKLTAKHKPLG